MSSHNLTEGPLSDTSHEEDTGHDGNKSPSLNISLGQAQFYNLQLEETASSLDATEANPLATTFNSEESSNLKEKRDNLKLDFENNPPVVASSELIFSPGGNEAYAFAPGHDTEETAVNTQNINSPRHLDEQFFTELTNRNVKKIPHGERPKTVGQSDDTPRKKQLNRNALQERLDDLRYSLQLATLASADEVSSTQTPSTAEPSPRQQRHRVPNINNDADEVETSPSITRRGAMSPSMASVTSGSTTASGVDGTQGMTWDYIADLNYDGQSLEKRKQKEAAANLSTLEKLAIGPYSKFLRTEPEGKPTVKSTFGRGLTLRTLPDSQKNEEELRNMRIRRFANSLEIQKQNAKMQKQKHQKPHENTSKSSKPLYSKSKSKSDTSPEGGSPMRRKLKKKIAESSQKNYNSGKSSSLTDLTVQKSTGGKSSKDMISSRHSTSDLSPRSFEKSSSNSSTGTVVPQSNWDEEIDRRILEAVNTDPSSLPVELYSIMSEAVQNEIKRNQQSQSSLNSKQSVETVITLEQLMSRQSVNSNSKKLNNEQRLRSSASKRNLPESDYSLDTDDEVQRLKQSSYFPRNDAEGSEANSDPQPQRAAIQDPSWEDEPNAVQRAQSLPPMSDKKEKNKRGQADTTSEDEKNKGGTLDSAPIDRAKSFEYFPGESFPLQENSSSYEYLPGHMIHDTRPPTVVSNRPQGPGGHSSSSNISTSPSVQSTSSNAVVSKSKKQRPRSRTQLGNDLARLSTHLMERSNQLHSAHVHQTMTFYSKLKDYIAFISTPSASPSDARMKQQIADKLLSLMRKEEDKLCEQPRRISTQLGVRPDFLDEDEAPTRKIESDEPDEGGQQEDVTAATTNEDLTSLPGLLLDDSNDLMIQKLRIEQMKKLRKEIRKLEKLEKFRLHKAISKDSPMLNEEELLEKLATKSVDSSVTTLSYSEKQPSFSEKQPSSSKTTTTTRPISNYRGIEGKSASGSDNNKQSTKDLNKINKKRKPSVASVREFAAGGGGGGITAAKKNAASATNTEDLNKHLTSKSGGKEKLTNIGVSNQEDFGQTFPTPRETTATTTTTENLQPAVVAVKKALPKNRSNKKRQPLAYYLPLEHASPIIIGKKILKEKSLESDSLSKENRNILANYLSAIDTNTITIEKQKPVKPKLPPKPTQPAKKLSSLQEALLNNRPDFVQKSQLRVDFLNKIREQRLIYTEKYKQWLILTDQANTLGMTYPLPPPPEMPQRPRLFNHQEMVSQAKAKYQRLPEVIYHRSEAKRKTSYKTNRMKASMYKKKLQKKVLQGQVTLTHHNQIL